jgi:hypothetical protein
MAKPLSDVKWMGEEPPETCPVCHRNLMVFEKGSMQVECAIRGLRAMASVMKLRPEQKIILAQSAGYPKKKT